MFTEKEEKVLLSLSHDVFQEINDFFVCFHKRNTRRINRGRLCQKFDENVKFSSLLVMFCLFVPFLFISEKSWPWRQPRLLINLNIMLAVTEGGATVFL